MWHATKTITSRELDKVVVVLGVLLLKVSEAIVRSGERLPAGRKLAGKSALEVNSVSVPLEIFVQRKSFAVTATDLTPEGTNVCSGVLSVASISGNSISKQYMVLLKVAGARENFGTRWTRELLVLLMAFSS
jgi:hypothetical protein